MAAERKTPGVSAFQDASDPLPAGGSSPDKAAFLATFTEEENKAIMKKVDRRFLLLIGILYLTKNLDYQNAAVVKVLQVGQPRNILTELHMTPDEYNWVQSIYFVSFDPFLIPYESLTESRSATSSSRFQATFCSRR